MQLKCSICNQQDIIPALFRVKGHGYVHQSCIDLAVSYLKKNLQDVTWSDIQDYTYGDKLK